MLTAIIVIHIVVSIVLIISVLLQAGKGASIGSTFGGASSQTLFGSAGPATFLTKITAFCALVFMATSLYLTFIGGAQRSSSIMRGVPAVTAPAEKPADAPPAAKTPTTETKEAKEKAPPKADDIKKAAPAAKTSSKNKAPETKAVPEKAKEPAAGAEE